MISLFYTLAQVAAPAKPDGPAGVIGSMPFMLAVMGVMFYFLILRPQQRQRKEQTARMAALKSGEKVVTTAGIHGIVHNVKETTVMVKVADGTILEFDKPAIATVTKRESKEA